MPRFNVAASKLAGKVTLQSLLTAASTGSAKQVVTSKQPSAMLVPASVLPASPASAAGTNFGGVGTFAVWQAPFTHVSPAAQVERTVPSLSVVAVPTHTKFSASRSCPT